ncbi:hypothetical protein CICLE_v10006877mg, partial [Citrus x clementina]
NLLVSIISRLINSHSIPNQLQILDVRMYKLFKKEQTGNPRKKILMKGIFRHKC